jgi:acyl carrier protein
MSDEEFLARFAEVVGQDPASLSLATDLKSIEDWDSVAYLGTTVMIDESMGVAVSPEIFVEAVTIGDVLAAARAAGG